MVVSGSGTTGVGGLAETVEVIIGSVEGVTFVGRFSGTVVVVGRSAGTAVVVVVVGTGAGSTGVEGLTETLV